MVVTKWGKKLEVFLIRLEAINVVVGVDKFGSTRIVVTFRASDCQRRLGDVNLAKIFKINSWAIPKTFLKLRNRKL